MSIEALEIVEPGLLTTVQDRGRYGYQRFGVPASGAMDVFALRAANLIVGNDEDAAGLEITVLGPRIRFLSDIWIAVTGADLSPTLDDHLLKQRRAVKISANSVLSFKGAQDGMRAYLAVAGGIDVPVVMGSRSTYAKGAIGGFEGRPLKAGDVLRTLSLEPGAVFAERRLPGNLKLPPYGQEHEIRVVLGPQEQAFTPDGVATFLGSSYKVSMQSDRMGYRLEGPSVQHRSTSNIVSDGVALGSVQVPGDGSPIVLLADRGTTGGYPKIATVISTDIGRLAQAMPGDTLTFKAVTVEEAHAFLRDQEEVLAAIGKDGDGMADGGRLGILVEGQAFEVVDEGGGAIAIPEAADTPGSGQSRRVRATVDGETYEFEVEVQQLD